MNNQADGDAEQASLTGQADDDAGPAPQILQQITPEMVSAGYQPGMASQQITVGDEGKGPKVPMIIAAVFLVIGILGIVIAGVAGSSLEDTLESIETGPYTSDITPGEALTHTDDDNAVKWAGIC